MHFRQSRAPDHVELDEELDAVGLGGGNAV